MFNFVRINAKSVALKSTVSSEYNGMFIVTNRCNYFK